MKRRKSLVMLITGLVMILSWGGSLLQGATTYVDDGQFAYGGIYWYYPAMGGFFFYSQYNFSYAKLSVEGVSGYDYSIDGSMSMTSALIDDDSSGTQARGYFQGGRTLTITGDIWNSSLYTNKEDDPYLYSGTILEATMTISSAETWLIYEDEQNDLYTGTVDFNPSTNTGSGLGYGISVAGGNVLKMDDFRLNCIFMDCEDVDGFTSASYITSNIANVQTIAIPEPVSVLLIGVGAFCCVRRSRKRL